MSMEPGGPPGCLPDVAVVMPVRDEADGLVAAVEAVLDQDYGGVVEV